jgi:hypothetical protein
MRCRECAAEVAVTARVCSRCGAPIVGQPPAAADAVVTDTVVGAVSDTAVSDAAGKAVAAGVAGHAPEPYVPGSGVGLPAELRLVLGEYAGIACGLSAGALACATALILFIFFADDLDRYNGLYDLLFGLAATAFTLGALWGPGLGLRRALTCSRRASDFPDCSGGAAIHARPR